MGDERYSDTQKFIKIMLIITKLMPTD